MFMYELWHLDGIFKFFFFVIIVGILSYVAGALYFAPNQKFKTVKLVLDQMAKHPDEFRVEGFNEPISGESLVFRYDTVSRLRFKDLLDATEDKQKQLDDCKAGLSSWGLQHIWNACEIRNAANCAERKHSIPFYRMARLGFMSEPSPKDLGGVLNANALYTFATGFLQIAFGVTAIFQFGLDLYVAFPLSISFVSLVLSLLNVFCAFSAILTELEQEQRMIEEIQKTSDRKLADDKKQVDRELQEAKQLIDEEDRKARGGEPPDASSIARKTKALEQANVNHQRHCRLLDQSNLESLESALAAYRYRLERFKDIVGSKGSNKPDTSRTNAIAEEIKKLEDADKILKEKEKDVNEVFNAEMDKIDFKSWSVEKVESEMKRATREKAQKLDLIQTERRTLAAVGGQADAPGTDEGVSPESQDPFLEHQRKGIYEWFAQELKKIDFNSDPDEAEVIAEGSPQEDDGP